MIGIIDFNPEAGTPSDELHYIEKIRALLPPGKADGIIFRDVSDLSTYDGLILSGSKLSAAAYQGMKQREGDYKGVERVAEQLRDYNGSAFGICFGSQLLALVAGGSVGTLEMAEVGYLPHGLTPAGKKDPVFGELPQRFFGAHLHNDFVKRLPKGGKVLARRNGMIYAYRLQRGDSMWYGCQPHPEMSTPENSTILANRALRSGIIGAGEYNVARVVPRDAEYALSKTLAKFAELVKN